MKYLVFIVGVICFYSCVIHDLSEEKVIKNKSNISLEYTFREVLLKEDSVAFKLYDIYRDSILIVDNRLTKNRLEAYNLKSERHLFTVNYSGLIGDINSFGNINSFKYYNSDTIFFLQDYVMSLSDTVNLKEQFEINREEDDLFLSNLDHSPLYYNSSEKKLSVGAYCVSCYTYKKAYYKSPIHMSYSLISKEKEKLPIGYSNKYLENYYGFHNLIFRNEYRDMYLIGFSADSNVYMYDKKTKGIKVKNGRSRFQKKTIEPLKQRYKNNSNEKLKHLTLSPFYHKIIYDKWNKLYYRFFLQSIPEKNDDGTYNGWKDKKIILLVFDNEFEIIDEINLGVNVYNPSKSFVGIGGLYLYKNYESKKERNKLSYDLLEFN